MLLMMHQIGCSCSLIHRMDDAPPATIETGGLESACGGVEAVGINRREAGMWKMGRHRSTRRKCFARRFGGAAILDALY